MPTRQLPDLLVRVAALFDPLVRTAVGELGAERHTDASHARDVLGWVPKRSVRELVREMVAGDLDVMRTAPITRGT